MYRVTTALPRLAACAVCVSAVVVQRRVQKAGGPQQPDGINRQETRQRSTATRAAAATLAPTAASGIQTRLPFSMTSTSLSTALVRTLGQVLRNMWLSLAIGAAASWATVNAAMVSTLKQLKVAAPAQVGQAPPVDVSTVKQFCGHWVKVQARSDSMDAFCQLFGVPRWLRQATRLMTGVHISVSGDELVIKQVCKLGWLSAVETFPLDGSCSKPQKRRDMRAGKQVGQLLEAHDSSMTVRVCWQGSLPGSAVDMLQLQETPQGLVLEVSHKAQVQERGTAAFKEVFRLNS